VQRIVLSGLMAAVLLAGSGKARADEMDVSLARLRVPAESGTACEPSTAEGPRDWCTDDANYKRIMSQLGMSMAPPIMSPARTVGPGGFHIGFDSWITGIDGGKRYWRQGTEGDAEGADEMCRGADGVRGCNRFAKDALAWSRLGVRKGFPFGLELGASVGHAYNTSYWTWGFSLKVAIFEGYREGPGKYIPDIAVRGMVQTLTGDGEFNLTVPSADLIFSKPLVAGDTAVFTPYFSTQALWIMADSELVDLTPGTNAVSECRPRTPSDAQRVNRMSSDPNQSTVVCRGDPTDFNNNAVFEDVRAMRWRLAFGLKFRYEILTLTGAFHFDVKDPADADDEVAFEDGGPGLPKQWTVSFGAGLQL
jgi:hypothetical protein